MRFTAMTKKTSNTYHPKQQPARARTLFTETMFHNIEVVQGIRNYFAHHHRQVTFDSPEVAQRCSRLIDQKHPIRLIRSDEKSVSWQLGGNTETSANNRERFSVIVSWLCWTIYATLPNSHAACNTEMGRYWPRLPERIQLIKADFQNPPD
ncbi:MAG: hypothetical protein U0903_03080 [Planctomycetales bacterium]